MINYLQAPWGEIVPVPAALGGKLVEIAAKQGSKVQKGQTSTRLIAHELSFSN